jgi:hypothetical protein
MRLSRWFGPALILLVAAAASAEGPAQRAVRVEKGPVLDGRSTIPVSPGSVHG